MIQPSFVEETQKPVVTNHVQHALASAPTEQDYRPGFYSGVLTLSGLLGATLLGMLVFVAGPWALLGNTRLLNLLISGGIVAYHDRQAGLIEGVANHSYYLKAQDPIAWSVVAIAIGCYVLIVTLKAVQFHMVARAYGIGGTWGSHARAFFYGQGHRDTLPLDTGEAAIAAALAERGVPVEDARQPLFAMRLLFLFEIGAFAIIGLLSTGWAAWLMQLLWALALVAVLYFWTRPARPDQAETAASTWGPAAGPTWATAVATHLAALAHHPLRLVLLLAASLLAFGLRDVAAYFTVMAFSTENVLLNIDPSLILMGVLGGYIASYIRLTPGGIGQFEWGFTTALFIGGVGLPEAVTAALLVNFFRYVALFFIWLATTLWHNIPTNLGDVMLLMRSAAWQNPVDARSAQAGAPVLSLPAQIYPTPWTLWRRAALVAWAGVGLWLFDRLLLILADLWLLQSLGLESVFWTNFRMGAALFVGGFLAYGVVAMLPIYMQRRVNARRLDGRLWRILALVAGLVGVVAGSVLAMRYHDLLPLFTHVPFAEVDPVFGQDLSFYVFMLPGIWILWKAVAGCVVLGLLVAIGSAGLAGGHMHPATGQNRLISWLAQAGTRATRVYLLLCGVVAAVGVWLLRYELLFKENDAASVFNGAAHIDVDGLLSTVGQISITALVVLGVAVGVVLILQQLHATARAGWTGDWWGRVRFYGTLCAALIAFDLVFAAAVAVRQIVAVTPNQPVIQLEYMRRHIQATRKAYGIDMVEVVELRPKPADAPLPALDRILNSPSIRNAPLWPATVTYLEQLLDPQHAQRILQTGGDNMVYGPTLEIFRQEQKLRTYYDFLSVAPLRFTIEGEPRVFVAAVREVPLLEPQPWLAWWGQRFMLYTHGHGLVMAPMAGLNPNGSPQFVVGDVPMQTAYAEFQLQNPHVYYGAGSASMAVSNVTDVEELDYPTAQGRAVNSLSPEIEAGVHVDSLLKRFVFGWRSGEFAQIFFSSLITPDTRLHYYRQPMTRLARIAPFLFFDNVPYPALVDGEIVWLVNGITTTDQYPYSKREFLGDKSISRTTDPIETRQVNYLEDSVKATVNAATGQVRFYQIHDGPIVATWAAIYPGMFTPGADMPAGVRQQLTYPTHLFHIQFDDVYIYYQMEDPMYFFNMEDMWDDADEVLGPLLDNGKAITFSMEPSHLLLETGGLLPATAQGTQFGLTMAFTPEGARNLRGMPVAYQDGEDYGRLVMLQVSKGEFMLGPEQADALIDQDPLISEQISWWNRLGTDVIRGHTSLIFIDDEPIYIEPIFIRSQQNPITQLKRVVVVFRGEAFMASSLEGAIRLALGESELRSLAHQVP